MWKRILFSNCTFSINYFRFQDSIDRDISYKLELLDHLEEW